MRAQKTCKQGAAPLPANGLEDQTLPATRCNVQNQLHLEMGCKCVRRMKFLGRTPKGR